MMDQKDHPAVPFLKRCHYSPQVIHHLIVKLYDEGSISLVVPRSRLDGFSFDSVEGVAFETALSGDTELCITVSQPSSDGQP